MWGLDRAAVDSALDAYIAFSPPSCPTSSSSSSVPSLFPIVFPGSQTHSHDDDDSSETGARTVLSSTPPTTGSKNMRGGDTCQFATGSGRGYECSMDHTAHNASMCSEI